MFYASKLRESKYWSPFLKDLTNSRSLQLQESPKLQHASIHLSKDNVSFLLFTSEDFKDPKAKSLALQVVDYMAKAASKSHIGVIYMVSLHDGPAFLDIQYLIYEQFKNLKPLPFVLELTQADELVPTLESFIHGFRVSKAAQAAQDVDSIQQRALYTISLLASANTSRMTRTSQLAIGVLMENYFNAGQWAEGCSGYTAKERLMALLREQGDEKEVEECVNGIVDFWEHDWVVI